MKRDYKINHLELVKEIEQQKRMLQKPVKTKQIALLMAKYELDLEEAVLFAVILKRYLKNNYSVSFSDIRDTYKLSNEQYFQYLKTVKSLCKKDMLVLESGSHRRSSNMIDPEINIDENVFFQIVLGEDVFDDVDFHSPFSIIDAGKNLYTKREEDKISEQRFFNEFSRLINKIDNQLEIYKLLVKYSTIEQVMIIIALEDKITGDGSVQSNRFCDDIYDSLRSKAVFMRHLYNKDLGVFKDKLLILDDDSRYINTPDFEITDTYYNKIMTAKTRKMKKEGLQLKYSKHLKHASFKQKLFLDEHISKYTETIAEASSKKGFNKIVKSLKKAHLPSGLVMLLHGFPGTGKTATVYEIAHKTKRDVLQVNISNIKDKYVGESEKRIKAIFTEYVEAKETLGYAPILLFNEADALIGARINVNDSVDQMYNSMQNILLEELENFEGIFFATTNLVDNIDTAFDRRFLYKVEFKKPSVEVRKKIWKSKIENLSDVDVDKIKEFNLTGGQIENVARKFLIDSILHFKEPNIEELVELCKQECSFKKHDSNKIGFGRQNG